ncbi:Kinesin heavy chain [Teratosphaeria destructans]|uniref:Kinesin heavy chain n=1 Tax=Teratosphaeria destructans TaxID=418781 RepID=A0A9W7SYJ8_9PEZI|nr:Kinesin heavy chain [Teratosphaeria destructans]
MALGDKAIGLLATVVVFFVLSWLLVGLRCAVRGHMLHVFGRDDFAMLIAQLVYSVFLICLCVAIAYGEGRHSWDLEPHDVRTAMAWMLVCEFLYCQTNALVKLALGLFLLRITTTPRYIVTVRILTGASIVMAELVGLLSLVQCRPISKFWNLDKEKGRCIDRRTYTHVLYGTSATNILSDVMYGLLPYFIMSDMQISRRQKAAVAAILGLGSMGSVATVARVAFLKDIAVHPNADFLYVTVDCTISALVEMGAGIIAGSLVTLRPLLRKLVSSNLLSDPHLVARRRSGPRSGTSWPFRYLKTSPAFVAKRTLGRWEEYGCSPRELDRWEKDRELATHITATAQPTDERGEEGRKQRQWMPKLWWRKMESVEEVVEPVAADMPKLVVNIQEEFEVR